MSRIGIIAEFNPLHLGHKYLIDEAKALGECVCVISSNFVQRGDTAICEKRVRTQMALDTGADLVLELPVCYSMSTAQNFALGGVFALVSAGCDTLIFGSEAGEVSPLLKTAEILNSKEFEEKLQKRLKSGVTFAKARQITAEECGAPKGILEGANNNLAIEYITAAKNLGCEINFKTVKRQGAGHDSEKAEGGFASASLIREKIISGDFGFAKKYMPENAFSLLNENNISDINRLDRAVLASLRTKTLDELESLPDVSEGLHNKLFSEIKVATSLFGVYNGVKSKRYTLARVRRIVLSAFLGLDNSFFMQTPPYVRVLGFNTVGKGIIREMRKKDNCNLVLKTNEIKKLGDRAQKMLDIESVATDLYMLSLKKAGECSLEYKAKIIKTE